MNKCKFCGIGKILFDKKIDFGCLGQRQLSASIWTDDGDHDLNVYLEDCNNPNNEPINVFCQIQYCPMCGRFLGSSDSKNNEPKSVFTKIIENVENPETALNEIAYECEKIEKRPVHAIFKSYFRKLKETADDPEHNNPGI